MQDVFRDFLYWMLGFAGVSVVYLLTALLIARRFFGGQDSSSATPDNTLRARPTERGVGGDPSGQTPDSPVIESLDATSFVRPATNRWSIVVVALLLAAILGPSLYELTRHFIAPPTTVPKPADAQAADGVSVEPLPERVE